MTDVLEELTTNSLSQRHVERRLDDWEARLRNLYARVTAWLASDILWKTIVLEDAVSIHEEPMRETNVPSRQLPALVVLKDGEPVARMEPRGLWVIGTNGRLDLSVGLDHYMIVDSAENFAEPRWMFMPSLDRTIRSAFTADRLLAVL